MNKFDFSLSSNEMAVIITEQNRFYFSAFPSSYGFLVCLNNESVLFVDGRYFEAAEKSVKNAKVVLSNNIKEQILDIVKKNNIEKVYCETNISVAEFNLLKNWIGDAELLSTDELSSFISNSREIKEQFEIDCIIKAQRIAEKSLDEVLKIIKVGITEKEIAAELEYRMRRNGADGISFDTIAICGKNTSLPHGVPTNNKVKTGDFITMDFGALYKGYHSDMTRTVAVGSITDKMKNVYDVVLNANLNALEQVQSGVAASFVDKGARDIIDSAGYGDYFIHSTGHGVGLDIHESPNVTKKNDNNLRKNQVITIEPGIYLPNEFGVRIEDMVVIKENYAENLTKFTKSLIIL